MKKQKKIQPDTATTSTPSMTNSKKKKMITTIKREVVEMKPTLTAAVEEKAEGSNIPTVAEEDGFGLNNNNEDWRTWWRPEVLVDEQMSWGSVWFPFMESQNGNASYSDVFEEEYDLWDLTSIKHVPP